MGQHRDDKSEPSKGRDPRDGGKRAVERDGDPDRDQKNDPKKYGKKNW